METGTSQLNIQRTKTQQPQVDFQNNLMESKKFKTDENLSNLNSERQQKIQQFQVQVKEKQYSNQKIETKNQISQDLQSKNIQKTVHEISQDIHKNGLDSQQKPIVENTEISSPKQSINIVQTENKQKITKTPKINNQNTIMTNQELNKQQEELFEEKLKEQNYTQILDQKQNKIKITKELEQNKNSHEQEYKLKSMNQSQDIKEFHNKDNQIKQKSDQKRNQEQLQLENLKQNKHLQEQQKQYQLKNLKIQNISSTNMQQPSQQYYFANNLILQDQSTNQKNFKNDSGDNSRSSFLCKRLKRNNISLQTQTNKTDMKRNSLMSLSQQKNKKNQYQQVEEENYNQQLKEQKKKKSSSYISEKHGKNSNSKINSRKNSKILSRNRESKSINITQNQQLEEENPILKKQREAKMNNYENPQDFLTKVDEVDLITNKYEKQAFLQKRKQKNKKIQKILHKVFFSKKPGYRQEDYPEVFTPKKKKLRSLTQVQTGNVNHQQINDSLGSPNKMFVKKSKIKPRPRDICPLYSLLNNQNYGKKSYLPLNSQQIFDSRPQSHNQRSNHQKNYIPLVSCQNWNLSTKQQCFHNQSNIKKSNNNNKSSSQQSLRPIRSNTSQQNFKQTYQEQKITKPIMTNKEYIRLRQKFPKMNDDQLEFYYKMDKISQKINKKEQENLETLRKEDNICDLPYIFYDESQNKERNNKQKQKILSNNKINQTMIYQSPYKISQIQQKSEIKPIKLKSKIKWPKKQQQEQIKIMRSQSGHTKSGGLYILQEKDIPKREILIEKLAQTQKKLIQKSDSYNVHDTNNYNQNGNAVKISHNQQQINNLIYQKDNKNKYVKMNKTFSQLNQNQNSNRNNLNLHNQTNTTQDFFRTNLDNTVSVRSQHFILGRSKLSIHQKNQ